MENYTPIPIEQYLKTSKVKDLPQEVKDEIRRVRTEYEYMSFEQFTELHVNLRIVRRVRKLKKPRRLFVCPEGKIWYFDFYHSAFNYCGYFYDETFLEQRAKEEAEKRRLIEEARAEKKRLKSEGAIKRTSAEKQLKEEITKLNKGFQEVKKKRPRIKK